MFEPTRRSRYCRAFIFDVENQTVVEVDEAGTVDTCLTTIRIGTSAVAELINLQIDHPFFYAIRDNRSG